MTTSAWGAVLGGTTALGLIFLVTTVVAGRRPRLDARVLPYLRDLTASASPGSPVRVPTVAAGVGSGGWKALVAPALRWAADAVDRVVGGSASVERRLRRAGLDRSVHDFRVEQVLWGLGGFAGCAAYGLLSSWRSPSDALPLVGLCAVGFVVGVLWRDNRLSGQVRRREQAILTEFPTIAELLALAVAAGEGPVAALDRVVHRSAGELSRDLGDVLAAIRTGEPVADAFDRLSATSGVPVVARFARGIAVAMERGTPLTEVLHAQAADVRESGRRELIEQASRREIVMMVPVVFLVLPVTVLFAFWPGLVGLSLTTP